MTRTSQGRELVLEGRATCAEARRFADACAAALSAWGVSAGPVEAAALAVTEACTNVARHAYGPAVRGPMRLRLALGASRVEIELVDGGRAFDPTRHRPDVVEPDPDDPSTWPEGGLGLAILGGLVDGIAWRRDAGRNHLTLSIGLPAARGTAEP